MTMFIADLQEYIKWCRMRNERRKFQIDDLKPANLGTGYAWMMPILMGQDYY